ncbi:MAG: hypothetical protein WBF05_16830, partial [Anaerolineales bacterium]
NAQYIWMRFTFRTPIPPPSNWLSKSARSSFVKSAMYFLFTLLPPFPLETAYSIRHNSSIYQ